MEILRDGTFSFNIEGASLARGMRPSKRSPRNAKYLVQCIGAVGLDNVLQVIDDLETDRVDTALIADPFPYPQIFIGTNLILVCGQSSIYELEAGVLVLKIVVAAGSLWSVVDFFDYLYMSNGTVAVIRDPTSKLYSLSTTLPTAEAICNFNGQVIIGGI